MIFYDNGLVVRPIYRYAEHLTSKDFLFLKEIAENPETKDAKYFFNFNDCGSYVICGDTLKVQMLHNYHSINDDWRGMEEWYIIIDGNIHILDWFPITTNQKEKEYFRKYHSVRTGVGAKIPFVPISAKPPLDYYWILKEKWFWCNEQDWRNYMEKMKQQNKRNITIR
jgi:hypothetical protein